jgi:hypothetical protein
VGYLSLELDRIPRDLSWYLLVLRNPFSPAEHAQSERLNAVFSHLARGSGKRALAVKGATERFEEDALKAYFGKGADDFVDLLPGLLISDTHPIEAERASLKLFMPFKKVDEKFFSDGIFYKSLFDLTHGRNEKFLERFIDEPDFVDRILQFAELKLEYLGFGINIGKWVKAQVTARRKERLLEP